MESKTGTLLVMNYVMDANHPVLSHQVHVVNSLSERFSKVVVVTGHHDTKTWSPPNVVIFDTRWVAGQNVRNIFRFYKKFLRVFHENTEIDFVFSHMTVIQSVLASPILMMNRIPHVLWYAHKASSLPLRIAHFVVQRMLTSTPGSCPIKSEKVQAIGQGIDTKIFKQINFKHREFLRAVHIGRADRSKRLEMLITETQRIRTSTRRNISLDIIGTPSNQEERFWFDGIQNEANQAKLGGWLHIRQGVNRLDVPGILSEMDFFVHAFNGSLDKTLIEATLCKVPVLTLNPEYLQIFGTWNKFGSISILAEYQALISLSMVEIENEISRRYQIAYQSHSYDQWITAIAKEIISLDDP